MIRASEQTDGQTDGQTGGWTDSSTNIHTNLVKEVGKREMISDTLHFWRSTSSS